MPQTRIVRVELNYFLLLVPQEHENIPTLRLQFPLLFYKSYVEIPFLHNLISLHWSHRNMR